MSQIARTLFLSATITLALQWGIRIVNAMLNWIAGNIDGHLPWIWVVELVELTYFLICRWVVTTTLQTRTTLIVD